MSIHVSPEPDWVTKEHGGIVESCVSCNSPTTYWHRPSNTPCCESCAFNLDEPSLMKARADALSAPKKTVRPF